MDPCTTEKKREEETDFVDNAKPLPILTYRTAKEEKARLRLTALQKKREQQEEKQQFRAIWKCASHRRRLRAASALLCFGLFGVTFLTERIFAAFGFGEWLAGALGALWAEVIACACGAVLAILLTYPLWLGMLSFASALWRGEEAAEAQLFSYYTDRRSRVFALRQGAFRALRFAAFAAATFAAAISFFRAADARAAAGDPVRAGLILSMLGGLLLVIPVVCFLQGLDFSFTRFWYREDGTCSLWEARFRSCREMREQRAPLCRLLLGALPMTAVSLLLFGVGIPLWVLPRFVLHAAGFACRPT